MANQDISYFSDSNVGDVEMNISSTPPPPPPPSISVKKLAKLFSKPDVESLLSFDTLDDGTYVLKVVLYGDKKRYICKLLEDSQIKSFMAKVESSLAQAETTTEPKNKSQIIGRSKRQTPTPQQLQELENSFQRMNYLNADTRYKLAKSLMLDQKQIKMWFRNRRAKENRNNNEKYKKIFRLN